MSSHRFPDTASVFAETAVCGCKEWWVEGLYKAQAKPPDKPAQIWTRKQEDKVKQATNKHFVGGFWADHQERAEYEGSRRGRGGDRSYRAVVL